jgi:putative transposase
MKKEVEEAIINNPSDRDIKATVKFKGKQYYNSFTYDDGITFNDGVLTLSKLGTFRMFYHRLLEGTIKTVTISRESDGWYACLSVDGIEPQPLPKTEQETGIDVGLESFLTTADGEHVENPRHYRVLEKKLAKAQRIMSRRKQGSQNWKDAKQTVATIGRKIARQRQDFHHKTALNLVQDYDTIYHEKLQVKNMIKNHHLAKSIGDAGWSGFISILEYKALYCGKETLGVPPHYTSQICSECGVIVKKSLSQRQHSCPVCGLSLHRDHNAALNILRVGQSLRGAVAIAP